MLFVNKMQIALWDTLNGFYDIYLLLFLSDSLILGCYLDAQDKISMSLYAQRVEEFEATTVWC